MGFLNDGTSNLSVEDVRRLIRDEVSLQVPAMPAGLVGLADGDIPLLRPPKATTNQLLTYSQATGTWSAKSAISSIVGTDAATPGTPGPVVLVAGPAYLQASWPRVTGTSDPLVYKVFIRPLVAPTTADDTYLVGTTTALSLVINSLTDGVTRLRSDTVYHVKVLALSILSGGATGAASADVSLAPGALDGTVTTISNLQAGNITAGDIDGARIQTNLLTTAKAVISQLSALQVDAGAITAGTFTGTTFRTAATNPKVQLDPTGMFASDAAGNTTFLVDAVTGTFKGAVYLNTSAGLTLQGGVSQPITSPTLSATVGGSLTASIPYFVTYAWASAQQLIYPNQVGFEVDNATSLTKLISTETYSVDTANARSGNQSLKCVTAATTGSGVALGSAAASVASDSPVMPSTQYTFSAYIKQNAGGANVSLEMAWKDATGAVLRTDTETAFAPTTSFVQHTTTQTSHASAAYVTCRVKIVANTATTFWLDDCELILGASASASPTVYRETPFFVTIPSVNTTVPNKTIQAILPVMPTGATNYRIYMDTATFVQGAGHLAATAAGNTVAQTTVSIATLNTSAGPSLTSAAIAFQGPFGTTATIQPSNAVDSTGTKYGWTLEGNGRIRFLGPTVNSQFWLYDDFYYAAGGYPAASGSGFGQGWLSNFTGTGATISAGTSTNADPGVMQLVTGTTTTGRAGVRTNLSFGLGIARFRFSVYFMVDNIAGATNSFQIVMGITDQGSTALAATDHGIVFQLNNDTTGNVLRLASADGSTLSTQNSGTTLTNGAWHFAEFEVDAGRTAINWWVDGTKQTAITTHIPAAAVMMEIVLNIIKTATGSGTASRTLNVDTVALFGDYVTG